MIESIIPRLKEQTEFDTIRFLICINTLTKPEKVKGFMAIEGIQLLMQVSPVIKSLRYLKTNLKQ